MTVEDLAPEERAERALSEAIEAIEGASEAGPIETIKAEREAVGEAIETIGEASANGLKSRLVGSYADALANNCQNQTKTAILDDIESHAQDIEEAQRAGAEGGDFTPIDEFLEQYVEEVRAVRSTDATADVLYRWHFDVPGADIEKFAIETGKDAGTSHMDWTALRFAIFDASSAWPGRPSTDEFARELAEVYGTVHEGTARVRNDGRNADDGERRPTELRSADDGLRDG